MGDSKRPMARNDFFDFLKGILIYLVVLGHTIQFIGFGYDEEFWTNKLWKLIYIFHMPLFIAISGYFSFSSIKKQSLIKYVKSRVVFLFIPMVVWCFIGLTVDVIIKNNDANLVSLLRQLFFRIESSYWFIWAIILYSLLVSSLSKLKLDNFYILSAIGLIMMIFPYLRPTFGLIETMYPFFIMGYCFVNMDFAKYYIWIRRGLPLLLLISLFCFYNWEKSTYPYITPSQWGAMNITVFRLLAAIILSITFVTISHFLYNKVSKSNFLMKIIIEFGRKSLSIYLVQTLFFYLIYKYTNYNVCQYWSSFVFVIPSFILTIVFYIFIRITSRNKTLGFFFYGNKRIQNTK